MNREHLLKLGFFRAELEGYCLVDRFQTPCGMNFLNDNCVWDEESARCLAKKCRDLQIDPDELRTWITQQQEN